jgi:hypothetical protein
MDNIFATSVAPPLKQPHKNQRNDSKTIVAVQPINFKGNQGATIITDALSTRTASVNPNSKAFLRNNNTDADKKNSATTENCKNMQSVEQLKISSDNTDVIDMSPLDQIKKNLLEDNFDSLKLIELISLVLQSNDDLQYENLLEIIIGEVKNSYGKKEKLDQLFKLNVVFIEYLNVSSLTFNNMFFEYLHQFNSSYHNEIIVILNLLVDPKKNLGIKYGFFTPCMFSPADQFFDLLVDIANSGAVNNEKIATIILSARKAIKNLILDKNKKYIGIVVNSTKYYYCLAENLVRIISKLNNDGHKKKLVKKFLVNRNINDKFRAFFHTCMMDKGHDYTLSSYFNFFTKISHKIAENEIRAAINYFYEQKSKALQIAET